MEISMEKLNVDIGALRVKQKFTKPSTNIYFLGSN